MKYQLVIQFKDTDFTDFDKLIEFEDSLESLVDSKSIVDGHDFGSGQVNFFIHTEDYEYLFQNLVKKLDIDKSVIAYRKMDGDKYYVLWPSNESTFEIL